MNILTYRGLSARVEFDADDGILVGRIAGIDDIVGFHAEDAVGIVAAFREAVDDYLETCAAVGKEAEKAFSGKLMLRVPPELHRRLALGAELSGKSLNQFGEELLTAGASVPSGELSRLLSLFAQQSGVAANDGDDAHRERA